MKLFHITFLSISLCLISSSQAHQKLDEPSEPEAIKIDNTISSDLQMFLPASVFNILMAFDMDSKVSRLNTQFSLYVKEINAMGVPDPVDHVIFTLLLVIVLYIPTKVVHMVLDTCYGSGHPSPVSGAAPQGQKGPDLGQMMTIVK
jgi:hypothetical protein